MKRRAPTVVLTVFGTLFSLTWVLFTSGLVVLTAPPAQPPIIRATPNVTQEQSPGVDVAPSEGGDSADDPDRVLTFLDVYTWHVLAAEIALGVGAIILVFMIARRRIAPRWRVPLILTVLVCISWIAILLLISSVAAPPFVRSGLALESTGRILGVVLTGAMLFATMIHFRKPPGTARSTSATNHDA